MAGPANIFIDCQKRKATSHIFAHRHKSDMKLFVESIRCLSFELDHKRWPMSLEAAGCGYVISRWTVALLSLGAAFSMHFWDHHGRHYDNHIQQ